MALHILVRAILRQRFHIQVQRHQMPITRRPRTRALLRYALHMLRGPIERHREHRPLIGRRRHARERANLRVADLAAPHRVGDLRETFERARYADSGEQQNSI